MKLDEKKYLFFQYLECTPNLDDNDRILGCACLRWTTGDEVDQIIKNITPTDRKRGTEIGDWCEVASFE